MPRIFVSYSSDAKPWAKRLSEFLERKKISIWTDLKPLEPGQSLVEELQDALDDAECFVIVVGPKNRIKRWQDLEVQAALQRTWADSSKRIIPVLVPGAELPSFLKDWEPIRLGANEPASHWTNRISDAISGTNSKAQGTLSKQTAKPDRALQTRLKGIERAVKQLKSAQEK
jgi:hypothetical protein